MIMKKKTKSQLYYKEVYSYLSQEEVIRERNAWNEFMLGCLYYFGLGVETDQKRAVYYMKLSADKGFSNAQFNLGACYENGTGTSEDKAAAIKYYRMAAVQGNIDGLYSLGLCYKNGYGEVAKNSLEALAYFVQAATQNGGSVEAQNWLGWFYEKGEIVTKNESEAVRWYQLSADKENAYGLYRLGLCYKNGVGVTTNTEMAKKYIQLSATLGNKDAMGALSEFN